jgi:predicted nucleic acid-binding protein
VSLLGVDTNVLVYWEMADLPEHAPVEAFFEREVYTGVHHLAIAPLVLYEFLHVVTDGRRFERPLSMVEALGRAERVWQAREVRQIHETLDVLPLALDLVRRHRLGRKRILDTALAATFRASGVERVLTTNEKDFEVFGFLEAVNPLRG